MREPSVILRSVRPYGEAAVDLLLRDGTIADMGAVVTDRSARVVECAGLTALPALVDLHTHLRDPGPGDAETLETGTLAAVAGGYSAVFAMANTDPVIDNVAAANSVHVRSALAAACDVFQVGAVTVGLKGHELTPLEELARSEAQVRVFSDDGQCVFDPVLMREALSRTAHVGAVLAQHAQCPHLSAGGQANAGPVAHALGVPPWPAVAEETIVARDIVLLAETADLGSRLHVCHVSTAGTVELLRWAKARGLPVTSEVTPHHLALVDTACLSDDTRFKVNPPLRSEKDRQAVLDGLIDGTIDVIATDHAPHGQDAKRRAWCDAPPGMIGLQTALPIVIDLLVKTGSMTLRQVAYAMSARPAQIGGVAHRHGRPIAVGEPANLCLVDLDAPWTVDIGHVRSIGKNTPYEGMQLSSSIAATFIRGRVAYDAGGRFPEV